MGQRFILLLALHPHFTLHKLGASSRSAGKKYKDAVRWKQNLPMSKELGELLVSECRPQDFEDCDLVFSGLDSDVAGDIGKKTVLEAMKTPSLSTPTNRKTSSNPYVSPPPSRLEIKPYFTHGRTHIQRFNSSNPIFRCSPTPRTTAVILWFP